MSELNSPMVNDKIRGNSGPCPGQKSGSAKSGGKKVLKKGTSKY